MKRHLMLVIPAMLWACGSDSTAPDIPAQPPVISSLSPAVGTAGTEVRIEGTGFAAGDVEAYFGDLRSPRVQLEGGALYAVAPRGVTAGTRYDVRVVNAGTAAATLTAAFEAVPPRATRMNGVTRPTGLVGMTVIVEGDAFGDLLSESDGKLYFQADDGSAIAAAIADSAGDWTNGFIVATVPQGTASTSKVWVETSTGASDSIEFRLINSGTFSPSTIAWTSTTPLPQPLSGLGAVFVPIDAGAAPANFIFTVGGADSLGIATTAVYRVRVQESGALDAWEDGPNPLPDARAYHATAAATAFTAALDTATTAAYLYAIGGIDSAGAVTGTVFYARVGLDGSVDAWQTTTPLPRPLHSAGAAIFRGYLYLTGGAVDGDTAVATTYRARVNANGTLGGWESLADLDSPRAYHSLVSFGPYLYAVGGESGISEPARSTQTTTESDGAALARINLRNGMLRDEGWAPLAAMPKARSKHGTIFAGGALFVTSGIYAGQPGSSENLYGSVRSDGSVESWNGATGAETIGAEIGYSLYNQAAVTFVDSSGTGHVLVLGGANRANGSASAAVVYY